MLEAVGMHLIDVTKFLRMVSDSSRDNEKDSSNFDLPDKTLPKQAKPSKKPNTSNSLRVIKEEEPQSLKDLSENVADFSLDRI